MEITVTLQKSARIASGQQHRLADLGTSSLDLGRQLSRSAASLFGPMPRRGIISDEEGDGPIILKSTLHQGGAPRYAVNNGLPQIDQNRVRVCNKPPKMISLVDAKRNVRPT